MSDTLSLEPTSLRSRDRATQNSEVHEIRVVLQVFMAGRAVRAANRVREVESKGTSYEFEGMVRWWNVLHDTP